jgi:hypothetical protein
MKVSVVPAVLSVILTAALTFGVYSASSADQNVVLLTIGSALTFLLTLGACVAVSLPDGRHSVNLKVFSGLMFVLALIVAFCFAGYGVNVAAYVIIQAILLVVHLLVVWKFVNL